MSRREYKPERITIEIKSDYFCKYDIINFFTTQFMIASIPSKNDKGNYQFDVLPTCNKMEYVREYPMTLGPEYEKGKIGSYTISFPIINKLSYDIFPKDYILCDTRGQVIEAIKRDYHKESIIEEDLHLSKFWWEEWERLKNLKINESL